MPEEMFLRWIFTLFALALLWLGLLAWTFHRLRIKHGATYEAIGSPDLFRNNTLRSNWLFFQFLFRGQWQGLGDSTLARASRLMQVVFVVSMLGFLSFAALFCLVGIERA